MLCRADGAQWIVGCMSDCGQNSEMSELPLIFLLAHKHKHISGAASSDGLKSPQ